MSPQLSSFLFGYKLNMIDTFTKVIDKLIPILWSCKKNIERTNVLEYDCVSLNRPNSLTFTP